VSNAVELERSSGMKRGPFKKAIPILALLLASAWATAEIMSPNMALDQMGFPADTPSLIRALSEGWPNSISPAPNHYAMSGTPLRRWDAYLTAIQVLGSRKATEAVPVLVRIVREPLPDPLVDDLLLDIPESNALADAWEEWDSAAGGENSRIRIAALQALANIDPESAKEDAVRFVEQLKPRVAESLQQEQPDESLWFAYSGICDLAARIGCKEGVDALVDLLPATKPGSMVGTLMAGQLEWVTGQSNPILQDTSPEAHAEAVRKWQAWWAAERERFVPATTPPPPAPKDYAYPPPEDAGKKEIVTAYLRASIETDVRGGDMIVKAYPEAEEWLKANAGRYTRQLRAIADDSSQSPALRETAANWYAQAGGKRAAKWLRGEVLAMEEVEPKKQIGWSSPSVRIRLLRQTWPEGYRDATRELIEKMLPGADGAALALLQDASGPEGLFLVLQNYDRLVTRYPSIRQLALQVFVRKPVEGDERVVVDGLRNGDMNDATWAALIVEQRGMEDRLPQDARAALEEWRKVPYFTLDVISRDLDTKRSAQRARVVKIVDSLNGTDAAHAQAYYRAYAMITGYMQDPVTPESEACLAKLKQCVAAYRAARPGKTLSALM
jgi:hypothetical protein